MISEATALFESGEAVYVRLGFAAARPFFDDAVDAFLESGCDLRSSWALMEAYRDLIEKVNRYSGVTSARQLHQLQEYTPAATELPGLPDATSPAAPLSGAVESAGQHESPHVVPTDPVTIVWDAGVIPAKPCVSGPAIDSAHALYGRLRSASQIRPKGEFETTGEYEYFKAVLANKRVLDETRYCFEVGGHVVGPFYDADKAEFTVRISSVAATRRSAPEAVKFVFQREVEARRSIIVDFEDDDDRSRPRPKVLVDADTIVLRLAAVPDVARRVKPLIGAYSYFVVGRVDHGRKAREKSDIRLEGRDTTELIDFVAEELVIVRGARRCVVARIPASRTARDLTYFTIE